jgi:hypothetical protein
MRWLAVTASVLALAVSAEPVARADDGLGARVAAADSYLTTRPGVVGCVLRDRKTGAVYRNAHAADPVWTASTIKLAMVVDLLSRQRSGTITLTGADNRLIAAMLHSSDDDAADTLWSRYGGADHGAFNNDFPAYGWVINTVGFAGKGQRCTLAVVNDLGDDGGYDDGVATTTHLSELLLADRDAG